MDLSIPECLKMSKEERREWWEKHPPRALAFEAEQRRNECEELLKAERKEKAHARIAKLKAKQAAKAAACTIPDEFRAWCAKRCKWIDTRDRVRRRKAALGLLTLLCGFLLTPAPDQRDDPDNAYVLTLHDRQEA